MREFLLDVFDLVKSASDKSYTHSIPFLAYVLGVFQNEPIIQVNELYFFPLAFPVIFPGLTVNSLQALVLLLSVLLFLRY